TLDLIRAIGIPEEHLPPLRNIPLDAPRPFADVIRTGRPAFWGSPAERDARFPELRTVSFVTSAFAALPLRSEERVFGALGLGFAETRRFDSSDRELMQTLAGQCAIALERTRLQEAERAAQRRLAFLAEASELLASSLDSDVTLQRLAALAVPELA